MDHPSASYWILIASQTARSPVLRHASGPVPADTRQKGHPQAGCDWRGRSKTKGPGMGIMEQTRFKGDIQGTHRVFLCIQIMEP